MCSPKGAGFLYARQEVQPLLEPLVVSWGWEPESTTLLSMDTAQVSPFVLQNEWQGTRDIAAYLSMPSAIEFLAEHGWTSVREECLDLLLYARKAITGLTS